MSDTKIVREACDHGRYDRHMWSGPKTVEMNQHQPMDWCRGGKVVVLREVELSHQDLDAGPLQLWVVEE